MVISLDSERHNTRRSTPYLNQCYKEQIQVDLDRFDLSFTVIQVFIFFFILVLAGLLNLGFFGGTPPRR